MSMKLLAFAAVPLLGMAMCCANPALAQNPPYKSKTNAAPTKSTTSGAKAITPDKTTTSTAKSNTPSAGPATTAAKPPMADKTSVAVQVDISGAQNENDAKLLSNLLEQNGIHVTVKQNKGMPERVNAKISESSDLGTIGKAIQDAQTSDRKSAAPHFDLVMFGKMSQDASKKLTETMAVIKGVNAEQSKSDLSAGELRIRIDGGAKVTLNDISTALKNAGFTFGFAQTVSTSAK